MRALLFFFFFTAGICSTTNGRAQTDSAAPKKAAKREINKIRFFQAFAADSGKNYLPRKATYRSAILPGWGQAYNHKYWKIPIVWGALGTTAVIFFKNVQQYKDARQAYIYATDTIPGNDYLIKEPYYSVRSTPEVIRNFRNEVRQNVDYSVLFFIIFWGLNVVDATVDAHLRSFDVGPNMSLQWKAGYSPLAHTNGISLILKAK